MLDVVMTQTEKLIYSRGASCYFQVTSRKQGGLRCGHSVELQESLDSGKDDGTE